ncbi:DegT/DnrJ/EryC1/StrS aminotransferase family protein [Candidatus Halobeggiatoa sp. HSG11]|nr:DegT/DnrJ/EryC1/StrS aminotransferase family protein [Candidatus Halobeggiatoa sp. HSG11]
MYKTSKSTTKIPLLVPDLPTTEELLPWLKCIDDNKWYSNFGPLVQEFESKLTEILNSNLTTVSSGTSALELSLLALDIPVGSKVLLPAFTFPATVTAVKHAGLQPIFTDVAADNWLLNPSIARQIRKKISYDVVIPVTTFGHPQPVNEWDKFYSDTGIKVLIDAASSFGVQPIGKNCIITFSFHATKPFGIGEGGLVIANSIEFIQQVRKLSNFGFENGVIIKSGYNGKLSEYHAAVGLAQLERWEQIIQRRKKIWDIYQDYLDKNTLQNMPKNYIPAILAVKFNTKKSIDYQFQTRRWYYPPLYKHPAFTDIPKFGPETENDLPITENLSLLGIPFHTSLTEDDIIYICDSLI